MTDAIVINADWGLMCCLDRWAVLLIWCNTKYLSVLGGSAVFYPIITSQVIVSKYSTDHMLKRNVSDIHHVYFLMVTCNLSVRTTPHAFTHGHVWGTKNALNMVASVTLPPPSYGTTSTLANVCKYKGCQGMDMYSNAFIVQGAPGSQAWNSVNLAGACFKFHSGSQVSSLSP